MNNNMTYAHNEITIPAIDKHAARRIASEWHGGMGSALYRLASTGVTVGVGRMLDEVDECIARFKGDDAESLMDLLALESWLLGKQYMMICNGPSGW